MHLGDRKLTTGLNGLDRVFTKMLPGDNLVWEVENIDNYISFAIPFYEGACKTGRRLIYFRFASHPPLLEHGEHLDIHILNPRNGFQQFIARIHSVIEEYKDDAYYLFDCLSELTEHWYSDRMLGNFFMLTAPCFKGMNTIAYYAIFRSHHSLHTTGPISDNAQILLETYRYEGKNYIHPLKIQSRFSSTMKMLHVWEGDSFEPVSSSAILSEIRSSVKWYGLQLETRLGFWQNIFSKARDVVKSISSGESKFEDHEELYHNLIQMILTREEKMLPLVHKYFDIKTIIRINERMVGTGQIGGKSLGMLLARNVLKQNDERYKNLLEAQDSFFIGSDIFYTFLVRNNVWWLAKGQKRDEETLLDGAREARRRIMNGVFEDYLVKKFERLLEYFGHTPFIIRSSSLLEDNFGNAFAGKYESVFCTNQGTAEQRLQEMLTAIKTIYASTISNKALLYRFQRGLLDLDEQMALLVMRVSGEMHGSYYYPTIAGVGFSFNPYAWNEYIDPSAGVIRLVFGLGTRAVDRSDDDYTRIVALNEPNRRPETNFDAVKQYSQKRVDYLDLHRNKLTSGYFIDIINDNSTNIPIHMLASLDRRVKHSPQLKPWVLTFDNLLSKTNFVDDMREAMKILECVYENPIDIEFTANFIKDSYYKINLVQCRPLQIKGTETFEMPDLDIPKANCIIKTHGAIIGKSRLTNINRFIYIVPSVYGYLPMQDRYQIARLIGEINHVKETNPPRKIMLLGPGRWGTSSPSLGIPVQFSEINHVTTICEIVTMHKDLVPDVSLGTHFLSELIEMDILYIAIVPNQADNYINHDFFEKSKNKLVDLIPTAEKWQHAIKVIDVCEVISDSNSCITLVANAPDQNVVCYYNDNCDNSK